MPVRVQLAERSYDIHVGAGVLARLGEIVHLALTSPARHAFIIADSEVPGSHLAIAKTSLQNAGLNVSQAHIPGGEVCKSLRWLEELLTQFSLARLDRTDVIIAIGGGAVCDLAGFAASSYRRGIPVIHCPTTLLAMVDASVGGKTAINLNVNGALKKNLVGAFWQPAAVIADVNLLQSLPSREFRAGLAECIKHGLISGHANDPALLPWMESHLQRLLNLDSSTLIELVTRNVELKASFVAADERELADDAQGGRALLNLGHTFGHVIESLRDVSADSLPAPLLHGECVALGLLAACVTGEALGLTPPGASHRVRTTLIAAGLPTSADDLPKTAQLIDLMRDDKKTTQGQLRLIVPRTDARACVVRAPDPSAIGAGWESIRSK